MLDYLLLVACLCILVALILYFFYWNRFIALVIGQTIRILYWNQESSSIWVEVGSIHFSLLAGRILLKDVCYHSSNQTFKIVKAQIQWRYWIRRPTIEEELPSMPGEAAQHSKRLWGCRIQFSFQGVEWFLYNRTAAYDNIIARMEKAARPVSRSSSRFHFFRRFARNNDSSQVYLTPRAVLRMPSFVGRGLTWLKKQLPSFDPKNLLPFGINIQTAAIILGNPSTPNLLVAEFRNAFGTYGIFPSRSKYDQYKQVLNLHFESPLIRLIENDDFIDPMHVVGRLVHNRARSHSTAQQPPFNQSYRIFSRLWRQLGLERLIMDYFARRQAQRITHKSLPSGFKKLRSVEEETPIGIDFATHEYAVERKVLEAPGLELTYYVDVVGDVPIDASPSRSTGGMCDIGNGDTDPEWGFDLVIFGGFVRFGPWTDRQRVELQHTFFPPTFCDHEITHHLKPGDKRVWTNLKIFVELRDETSLHIPFREPSKDWQWDGVVNVPHRPRRREPAFFNLTIGDRSSINYVVPMVIGPSGYEPALEVHLDRVTITSSLNDIRLVMAESTRIHGRLPTPVRWNAERTWSVAIYLRQPTLYILRDHVNMLTDLGRDWVSGPAADYQKFTPIIYAFRLELHNYELNLYVNDHNIIDKPLIRNENAFLTIRGPNVEMIVTIPSNKFRPETTSIPFTVSAPNLVGNFSLPRWSTHALHPQEGISLFRTHLFNLGGSYRFFGEVRDDNVEQLKLDIQLNETVFRTFGWAIRYFLVLRENYFGSFTQFQTLYEYLNKLENNLPIGDPLKLKHRPGKANMLEVELQLRAERSTLLLPTILVGSSSNTLDDMEVFKNSVSLTVPDIQLQLRLHDYYMEMSLNSDRVLASTFHDEKGQFSFQTPHEILMIDGIDIVANRLFGPQPRTAVYVCVWEISVGDVKISVSANQAAILVAAGNAFACNFVDLVNAPARDFAVVLDPDVTFYKVSVKTVEATWNAGQAALFACFPNGIKLDRNDLSTNLYKKVTSLHLPGVSVKILLTGSRRPKAWLEAAEISSEAYIDIYSSPFNHQALTRAQLAFIEEQDALTGRAKRILNQLNQTGHSKFQSHGISYRNGVYIPEPRLPCRAPVQEHPPDNSRSGHFRPPSWRLSTVANLSDTDAEEGVSEADRDARLARTRTSTPVLRPNDDNVASSSGDESDDADLTDGDSSEDVWSDMDESSHGHHIASLLSFYSPIVRHYSSMARDSWDGVLFKLTRENVTFMQPHFPKNVPRNPATTPYPPPSDNFHGEDITTILMKCRTMLLIFTPLALPASIHFEEDMNSTVPNAEIYVDALLNLCGRQLASKEKPSCTVLDIDIDSVTSLAIQHTPMLDETHPDIFRTKAFTTPSNLDILSILHASSGVRFSGIFRRSSPVIRISLSELAVSFHTSLDKRTLHVSKPKSTIFDLKCSSASINFMQSSLAADLGAISVEIGHTGPELVTAACLALTLSASSHFFQLPRRVREHEQRKKRATIATILTLSQDRPVVDPLSTIQPSYLVQSGLPQLLRTDVSFRFLYHLRNCLDKPLSQVSSSEVDIGELNSLVEARLTRLDPDANIADYHNSLGSWFQNSPSSSNYLMAHIRMVSIFSMRLDSLKIAVTAPSTGSSSELSIYNVETDVRFKKQDLVQFNPNNPSSASQTSLRAKSPKVVRKAAITLSLGDIDLIIVPHLMNFAQHILRINTQLAGKVSETVLRKRVTVDGVEKLTTKVLHTEVIGVVHRLRIQAAAENLVLVIGLNDLRTATSLLAIQTKLLSVNGSALLEEIYLQARSPSDPFTENDHDVLAALSFMKGTSNIVSRSDSRSRLNLKFVFLMSGIKLHVPRSALRLYRFVEEWRQDYLPGLEATLNTLLSEYRASPPKSPRSPTLSHHHTAIQIHGQINHVEVSLQVMHGTWLLWEMHKLMGYVENSGPLASNTNHAFGVQVGSMVLNVSSRPADVAPSSRVKITLPPLSVAGNSKSSRIYMLVLLEFMDLKVKPSHWDTLLAVQQKFGQDFNDLLILMQETRQKSLPDNKPSAGGQRIHYVAHIRMQGFRIGLVGLSSTVFLDCQDINGGFTSADDWTWDLGLSDLALSLAPRISGPQSTSFNRKQRSAFVIIDINLSGSSPLGRSDKNIRISVSKIHAVMQPSAIGEFGDFMDNLQAEMFERQEQRSLELAAFKVKAQTILQTFDVNVGDSQLEKVSWLDDLIISISVQNVGVAFPLTHDEELQIIRSKTKESLAVRAFLFSIKAIDFTATRGETGQATMRRLCLQFVPKFKQSSPEDFAAEKHQTRNCLLYPDMQAQLRTSTMGSLRKVWIRADVSGFILDIDSTIPSYVFSLIDVYRQGKERVERLSSIAPRTPLSALPITENVTPSLQRHYTAVPTSNVFSQLTFLSGKVRFYSASAIIEFKNRTALSQTFVDISDDHILDLGAEVFNLPVVSVWAEYRATPASRKLAKDSESEPSLLVFKSTVFSSHNTLRPTLLPFLTELVSRIETRMRKVSARSAHPPTHPPSTDKAQEMDMVSSMKLSFSLRIDKSTLELTCQPDVNVVAGLNWESGGFIVNISPGARRVYFSGSVGGLTVGLKHGFLSEDCVKLDARNLVFSVSFTKTERRGGEVVNSVSVVLDTEFLGGVRFSRLQDILCFKAVWLDRIPVLDSQMGAVEAKKAKSPLAENSPSSRGFSTAILIRIRQIALEVDLGQSVSRLNLDLDQIIFRTTFTDDQSEVFLYIADISISAHGNLSGRARVPDCVFQTIRRSEETLLENEGKYCTLELRLTSGALIADLESDFQNILYYRAEPLKLEILDDWSQTLATVNDKDRPVHLSFTINCPEIVAAITIGTIPKLLSYMKKFQANVDVQRQGAYRESQTFRVTWAPKPDNPLSAVGETMLHSARNRFKESVVSLAVRQHMRVRLDSLRLIAFPRTMKDLEIAQFIGNDVRARLDGLVVSAAPLAERELHLSFSSMVISKYNRTRPVHQQHNRLERPGDDGREWLAALLKDTTEANIVGLPSMKMHMISEESEGDSERILTYDFFSQFVRREGMKAFEDIYITLNMSLYAWLTVLRKNLTREMDQVKASEDWRSSMTAGSTAISHVSQAASPSRGKKKVPEPLPLPLVHADPSSRSSSMPSATILGGGGLLSPPLSGPQSTRFASLEATQSPLSARDNLLLSPSSATSASPIQFPSLAREKEICEDSSTTSQPPPSKKKAMVYKHRNRQIERLTMRQLGEATPDVMHPFFMKKAGFSLEDSLPQYVHEYATSPLEEILEVLLKLYSRQLLGSSRSPQNHLGDT